MSSNIQLLKVFENESPAPKVDEEREMATDAMRQDSVFPPTGDKDGNAGPGQAREVLPKESTVANSTSKLIEEYKTSSGERKKDLFAQLDRTADTLVKEADAELLDQNRLPIHVRENYETALAVKETLYGPSKQYLDALDRLAKFFKIGSGRSESIKYQERALAVAKEISPNDYFSLVSRTTRLAQDCQLAGNQELSGRYFNETNKMWQQRTAIGNYDGNEQQADDACAKKDYWGAASKYLRELSALDSKLKEYSQEGLDLSANPRTARLHQKLGDVYLANGDIKKAQDQYRDASDCLGRFVQKFGGGKVLPEQITALTSRLVATCKSQAELEKRAVPVGVNFPEEIAAFSNQLREMHSKLGQEGLPQAAAIYKANPGTLTYLEKAFQTKFDNHEYDKSASISEQIYLMKVAQGADTNSQIDMLVATAHQYFLAGDINRSNYNRQKALDTAIKEFPPDNQFLEPALKSIATAHANDAQHEQSAAVWESLYKIQLDQNARPEKLVETLRSLSNAHFLSGDLGKATADLEQLVKTIGNDKNLYPLLQPPNFLSSVSPILWEVQFKPYIEKVKPSPAQLSNDLNQLTNVLNTAANRLYSEEESRSASAHFYANAVRACQKSLEVGAKVDYKMLTRISEMLNWSEKFMNNEKIDGDRANVILKDATNGLADIAEKAIKSDYKQDDPALKPILDNLQRYRQRQKGMDF